ncbi:general substrate transporter [Penicillium malachiteum]|uniref:general substrate transporter n=1 Tax=Penicillium malachiteum TaxID=1324776 RepID=UPI002548B527|nr:general substrate transporter [Penicillium malachiteum]KAJ5731199.1 general substrate transporter [Penicillium malachiteum]
MRSWYGRGKPLQKAITACCLVAFILFGYDQGVFSSIVTNENWKKQFNYPNDSKEGIIVAITLVALNFFVGENLGRRKTMWLAMAVVIVGAILQTAAFTVPHLGIGRIVTGAGTGIKTSTVPMYQAEMCEGKTRGRLISSEVLFTAVGIVIAYWLDFGISYTDGAIAWRLPIAIQIFFAIFVIVLVFGLPESPRWLMNHGREREAVDVLCAVYDLEEHDDFIVKEHRAIQSALELDNFSSKKSVWKIFRNDEIKTGQRVLLAWGMQLMNQVGGINMIVYYIPTVLQNNVGLTGKLPSILGGCVEVMFMIGSLLPAFMLDRMGRRRTMMIGSFGLGVCMLMIAALLSQVNEPHGKEYASASVAFFFLYMLIHGMSINSVPWVYVPEILPLEARTKGTAIGVSSNWLWNFTIVMITPVIINRIQWKAYIIFMMTNFLFIPVVYFFYPETGNLRLEDVDLIFSRGGDPVKQARLLAAELKANGRIESDDNLDEKEIEAVVIEHA